MRIIILTLFFLTGFNSFSQQKDSLQILRPRVINLVAPDSARVALDIVVDSLGKFITATYSPDSSTSNDEKMIEIAKRRASQLKYPAIKEGFTQRLIFHFKVVQ